MCWGSYDSDYRGLKKRITAIRRAQGSSAGSHINVSSESELDIFPRESGASAHRSDGEEIVDEGHEADNETSIHSGRHAQQTVVDARDGEIEFKELNHGHSKVDTVCFFFLHAFNIFPRSRSVHPSIPLLPRNYHQFPGMGPVLPPRRRQRPNHRHYPYTIRAHGMVCVDVPLDEVIIFFVEFHVLA